MKLKASMALLIASCAAGAAYAEDGFPPVTISGFGTLALTRTNTDDAEFARLNQDRGASTSARSGVDSSFGLQVSSKLNDRLSLTAQGLVRKAVVDSYGAELSLAFAQVKVNDDTSVRIGRVGIPVYYISEYRNVGYASTMIRPPVEMYNQVPFDTIDGVDGIYRTSLGNTSLTAQGVVGKSDFETGIDTFQLRRIASINLLAENGPFIFRLQHLTVSVSSTRPLLGGISDGLAAIGYPDEGKKLRLDGSVTRFTSVGFGMDWKNIVAQAEYGKSTSENAVITDSHSWYTMLGYRVGKVLPYINYSTKSQDSPRSFPALPTGGPKEVQGLVGLANGLLKGSLQTSSSIGVRWDFHKSAAFKLQLDRVSPKDGPGTFIHAKPGFKGPVTVVAGGVDFVF